jgi:hypothetical protein
VVTWNWRFLPFLIMYGLLALYIGYIIYLIFYFRHKKPDSFAKKITIFFGIKLIILTLLYFFFFSHKMTKEERKINIETIILK